MTDTQTSNTPGSVNTNDLAKELAQSDLGKEMGLTGASATRLILAFVHVIADNVAKGNMVRVHNLGNLKVLPTKARKGKNPQTGEEITIEASKRVHLVVAQHLKESAVTGKVPVRERATPAPKAPAAKKAPAKGKKAAAKAPEGGFAPPAAPAAPAAKSTEDI